MKRVAIWLVRLYPSAWRGRYGDEFADFLEQYQSICLRDVLDIVIGICDAYLYPQRSVAMADRKESTFILIGLCPLISTILFIIGLGVLLTSEVLGLLFIFLSILPNILLPFIIAQTARQRLVIGLASPLIALAFGMALLLIFGVSIRDNLFALRLSEMLSGSIGVALILANVKDNGLPRPLAVVGILLGANWLLHHSLMMLDVGNSPIMTFDPNLIGITLMILFAFGFTWVLGMFIWLAWRKGKPSEAQTA